MAATTVSLSSQLIRLGEEVKEIENRREKLEEKRYKLKSELSSLSKTEEKDKAKAAKIASEITKLTALIKETNNEYKLKAKEENAVMAALNRTGFRKG
jgi:chromosome segregation ATPase